MSTRRQILLDALDDWHREGSIDEPTWRFLRSRYEHAPPGELDAPLAPAAEPAEPLASAPREKGAFAFDAMQFVGGLLLGAATIALVLYLDVPDANVPWVLLGLAGIGMAAAAAARYGLGEAKAGLTEAALAAGLVPAAVAGGYAIDDGPTLAAAGAAVLAIAAQLLRRGQGPSSVLAAAAFSLGSVAVVFRDIGSEPSLAQAFLWFAVLSGYLAFLLIQRRIGWTGVAAGAMAIPLTIAWIVLMMQTFDHLESVAVELLVGLLLAALMGVGIWLSTRALVAAAAAGLTIDAIVFAFDVGGALTALVVLVTLGGLLVWQAQLIRSYFGRHARVQQRL